MAKWAEIKCPRCDEQDALWEGMERSLEESDAREARLEARIEELEAKLQLIQEEWNSALYGDLEHGVASLNAAVARDFHSKYPNLAAFGAVLDRIIEGDTP
jgi:chromosome segregation ATPase